MNRIFGKARDTGIFGGQAEQSDSAVNRTTGKKVGITVSLGEAVRQLMDEQVAPRQAKFGGVSELWKQLLPPELSRHCEIADISGGQLKVQVDSPSYMYELRLCGSQLLAELQRQCPRARLKNIKFVVA